MREGGWEGGREGEGGRRDGLNRESEGERECEVVRREGRRGKKVSSEGNK